MLGYKPEEWTSDPDQWIKIMHPQTASAVLAEVARTDETGDPSGWSSGSSPGTVG